MDGTSLDRRWEIPCTLPLSGCCFLIRNSFWSEQASFCLFLFSGKCVYPFASAAGHHTFPAILGFSFWSYPTAYVISSRDHCTVFSIELSYFVLGEIGGRNIERMGEGRTCICLLIVAQGVVNTSRLARPWAAHFCMHQFTQFLQQF